MKKLSMWVIFSMIFLLTLMGINVTTAHAGFISDSDGLNAAPTGININNIISPSSLFIQGRNTLPSTVTNSRIIHVIQGNANQVSSVWSNQSADNYFDTGNKQKLSAWIYMGSSTGGSEGMAFVIQNVGTNAIALNGSSIAGGETLGVWGSDLTSKSTTDAMAKSAIQKSWALEFDTRSAGLTSSQIDAGTGGTLGKTLDSYQRGADESGNQSGRSLPDQHLGWAYPGSEKAYVKIGSVGPLGKNPYYELRHNGIEENTFSAPKTPAMAWHHLLITYTPPTKADPYTASLRYDFNDKTIDGHLNNNSTGQNHQEATVPLDLRRLGAVAGDHLYYGFTAANASDDPTTNAVVFETLPSIVNGYGNAYVVDKTNQTKVSSSTDVMTDYDKSLAETTAVHPNDELSFNYMLKYDSGKQSMDPITASIDVPDNVKVKEDSDGNIGYVVYEDGQASEPIPYKDLSNSKITYTLKRPLDLNLKWAKIEINATANTVPDANTALQVPLSHATLEGDNYKTDVQTPPFLIQAAQDNLTLTKTSKDPTTTSPSKSVNLTGTMKYDKQSTVKNSDINFYVSVDGGENKVYKDTASADGSFSIPFSDADVGKHTITVQAINPNYVSSDGIKDTVASNTLTYTVNVEAKKLQIASNSPSDIVAVGNNDLSIDGTDSYNDDSSFKNSDMTLHTVINGTETTTKLTGDDTLTSGKFTANIPANLIKDGKTNTVDLYITDNATTPLKSNTLSYQVTVPDTNLILSTDNTDITTFVKENATLNGDLSYADGSEFKKSDMTLHINVDGTDLPSESLTGNTDSATNSFEKVFAGSDLGVGKHTIVMYVTDVHGRESNHQTYNVDVIDKELSMTAKSEYNFQFIRSTDKSQMIPREDDWGIEVNSTNSAWVLTAKSSSLVDGSGNAFNGELTFINAAGIKNSMQAGQVLIDKDTTVSTTPEKTDVSSQWAKDQGVLLQVNSGLVERGKYTGTIQWNLSDSIQN